MPFIAPLIPALVGGVGAGVGSAALGSLLSRSSPSSTEQNVLNLNANAMRTGAGQAGQLFPQASNLIGMGAQGYQPVLNYWSSILSGNRPAITSALAPEISRIGEGYRTASATSAALNPRSGPSVAFNAELPFQQQKDVSTLFQTARPQAASGLFQAAQGATGAGSTLFGNAVNALYGGTAAGANILQQQEELRRLETERGESIGSGLFDALQKYGMPAISQLFKGTGTSTVKNLPGSISTGDIFRTPPFVNTGVTA